MADQLANKSEVKLFQDTVEGVAEEEWVWGFIKTNIFFSIFFVSYFKLFTNVMYLYYIYITG